ncbi:MAG: hypothetical protein HYT41_02475 [Candidatus Sungbacteria bacterium]|nr:hypothetical protein [Candidatus Sungbacteria bacterium]
MKEFSKSFAKAAAYPFFRAYFRFRAWWPVWFYVLNRDSRRRYRRNLPALNDVQNRIIRDLRRDGVATTHMDELFPGENILPVLRERVRALREASSARAKKPFLIHLWDTIPFLDLEDPFTRLALLPRTLGVVNAYLEMYGVFYYLTLNVTTPVSADAPAVASQRWHRDPEDDRMCKMFLYVNDVDEGAGPFTYITGSQHGGRYGKMFLPTPPRGTYPGDEAVDHAIPKSAIRSFMGRAGTIVFADTGGLHRGGYATKSERIMFTGGFCSPRSVWPMRFVYPPSFDEALAKISDPAMKFALERRRDSFAAYLFDRLARVYKSK